MTGTAHIQVLPQSVPPLSSSGGGFGGPEGQPGFSGGFSSERLAGAGGGFSLSPFSQAPVPQGPGTPPVQPNGVPNPPPQQPAPVNPPPKPPGSGSGPSTPPPVKPPTTGPSGGGSGSSSPPIPLGPIPTGPTL